MAAAVKSKPKTKAAPKATTAKAKPATKASAAKPAAKAKAPATKSAPKGKGKAAKVEVKSANVGLPREFDVHGFLVGSDSQIIANALTEGGETKTQIIREAAEKIEKENGLVTRNGTEKAISSLASSVLRTLQDKGYTVEASYKVVPPAEVAAEMKKAARAAARKSSKK